MLTAKDSTTAPDKAMPTASLRVYNTLSKTKEPFEPVSPGKVGMYLCGPTVYKPSHIGHMVGPVIFDAVKRYLEYNSFKVTFVVNITDVDDKLINESNARKMSMADLAKEMTADYLANLDAMGVDTIDHFPKATDHIDEIIKITQTLIDKRFAYESAGDVYFDVAHDPQYGKLIQPRRLQHARRRGRHGRAQTLADATLPCGKAPNRANPPGTAPGAKAGPAGTSSARP